LSVAGGARIRAYGLKWAFDGNPDGNRL